jgi:hypothetical protein
MKLIEKIAKAKLEIKETKFKKEGTNPFSHYDYFTPSQVELLVNNVCKVNNLLTKFDLIRNELGVFGRLTVFDCNSDEKLEYEMASAIPEIKATNIVQQLGGAVTYTERYLKMSAFGITDNQLDFDSEQKPEPPKKEIETTDTKQWLSDKQVEEACKRMIAGEKDLFDSLKATFKISKANYAKLELSYKN